MRNKTTMHIVLLILFCALHAASNDTWIWLEEVDGTKALAWVNEQNQRTAAELKTKPEFEPLYKQALETLNSSSRIPSVAQRGKWLYNFWKDAEHPRGVYRRTTIEEFRKAEPRWETVLDMDLLSEKEEKQWVFHGMDCLEPDYDRCLVSLAPGGSDASEIREFDMAKLNFVTEGFFLPVSKSSASWMDGNTLFVGPDTGGDSVTESGYPRSAKIWLRGTSLTSAQTIYEGKVASVSSRAYRIRTDAGNIDLVTERPSFWTEIHFQLVDGKLQKLTLPETAVVEGGFHGKLVISLKEDWTSGNKKFIEGSVIVADPEALRGGNGVIELLAAPTATEMIEKVVPAKSAILIETIHNVRGRLYQYTYTEGAPARNGIPFPENGAIDISSVDDITGDFFVQFQSFITPPTLYYVEARDLKPQKMKAQDATFDGSKFDVNQYWATSHDGTKVPYFIVMKKGTRLNGKNPTHIFSYGGFRNSLTPSYSGSYEQLSGAYGKLWLVRGGVFVLANIRGGGEFGPAWHKSALRENRVKSFEDFEAIVRDLFARKITSPKHLGIEGRSNGGLLVMALLTRHPELYGAVICGSPLVDMLRYHKMLAGASWVAEFGNPEVPGDLKFLETYSPYQLLKKGQKYPPVFFYASTRDDRVHPGHARKTVARMLELGYSDTLFYENTEGGHGASSTNEQLAYRLALAYAHLWQRLK
ncbi:prolyl oligopeptidase family serine peptidase [bacterium]|nr:prolyl oligopeptidase family serine peptidase [bacterium]MCI0602108.1 prolyl oligopeptidase family serine peptidase [bacterium]